MPVSPAVAAVLDGLVDLHCHSGPSPFPRRFDHVEAAEDGARLGMRAMVAKSHHHSTVMDLLGMQGRLEGVATRAYGGIALNTWVGGVNPDAVQMALNLGGKVVWFPTNCSGRHLDCHPEGAGFPTSTVELNITRIDIVDDRGELLPAVHDVLDLIRDSGAILNGGHGHPDHILALFTAAKEHGIEKMLLSHPDFVIGADLPRVRELVALGAYVEHEMVMYHPDALAWDIDNLVRWIEEIGPEHTTFGSDLGQVGNPAPVDGFAGVTELLLDRGVQDKDIRRMAVENPGRLLGLDD